MRRAYLTAALIAAASTPAAADDSVGTGDTVASTWSGSAFQLAESDKRFNLALGTLLDGVRLRAEVSAPLDDTTRTAAFLGKTGVAPAFRTALHIGYDSTYRALALEPADGDLLAYCEANKIDPCTESKVAEVKLQAAAARKHNGQPVGVAARYWAFGLDVAYAYDRTTAYVGDVAAATTATFSDTDLQIGASAMLYVPGGWVATLRGGYERSNKVDIGDFMRCDALPSSNMSVTGQTCSDQHYLIDDPGPQQSAYLRVSGAYYPVHSLLANYVSAAELRLNLENITTDAASFDVHLLVFAKGLDVGGGNIRVGVGTTVRTALASPAGSDIKRGDIYEYSLFGIVGTSF